MKGRNKILGLILFAIILLTGIFWFQPDPVLDEGMIIATAIPADADLIGDPRGVDGRYYDQASIIAIDLSEEQKEPIVLTDEFYSARSPEVSYEGDRLVFTAQKAEGDLWQIYVLDLITNDIKQVTDCPVSCTDPAWLPDGRVLYSRLNEEEHGGRMHVLYAAHADGCCKERLTFYPESAIASSLTMDGRIVTLSRQEYPGQGTRQYMTLRIDGTKSELFYKGEQGTFPVSRAWETEDGRIYFIESNEPAGAGNLIASVDFGHPLSSRETAYQAKAGHLHSLFPHEPGQLIVSGRRNNSEPFGLYLFNTATGEMVDKLADLSGSHLIEPVVRKVREVPMQLPAIVDPSKEHGTFLCHDATQSMHDVDERKEDKETHRVQVFGLDKMLGEVPVEADGSFYIKIDADMPVRFQTVNDAGEVLRGPSSWVWVRPGERRSCIGCHEDRELAPENRVPDALYSGMVTLPEGTTTEPVVLSGKNE